MQINFLSDHARVCYIIFSYLISFSFLISRRTIQVDCNFKFVHEPHASGTVQRLNNTSVRFQPLFSVSKRGTFYKSRDKCKLLAFTFPSQPLNRQHLVGTFQRLVDGGEVEMTSNWKKKREILYYGN